MPTYQVALVSQVPDIASSDLTAVAAALQLQATRDFGPIWGIDATVASFATLEDVPLGSWPVMIRNDINDPSALGYHQDNNGQPFSLILFQDHWPLTCSHELLEMICDPSGNRLVAGDSIHPDQQGEQVQYLVEVCDPCEDAAFAYTINDVTVSDFYKPNYFDSAATANMTYSFTGALTQSRQVLSGGYLSFYEPSSGHWFQARFFGDSLTFVDLNAPTGQVSSLREWIDSMTTPEQIKAAAKRPPSARRAFRPPSARGVSSRRARAKSLQDYIAKKFLKKKG